MEGSKNGETTNELPRVCQLLAWVQKRICRQGVSNAEADAQQRKEVQMERRSTLSSSLLLHATIPSLFKYSLPSFCIKICLRI